MGLKSLQGFGNKKVLDLLKASNIEKIDSFLNGKIDLKQFDSVYEQCKKNGIKIISYFDKEYPVKLKRIDVPPVVLFAKGDIELLNWAQNNREFTEEKRSEVVNLHSKLINKWQRVIDVLEAAKIEK